LHMLLKILLAKGVNLILFPILLIGNAVDGLVCYGISKNTIKHTCGRMVCMQACIDSSEGVRIKCQRCGHERTYRGSNPFFTSCTYCRTTISLRKIKNNLAGSKGDCALCPTQPVEATIKSDASK
jgi:hypothetical protein